MFTALKKVRGRNMLGFSLGIDPYSDYSLALAPLTLDARHYFFTGKKCPFLYGYAGYGFDLTSHFPIQRGEFLFGGGLGQSFRTRNQKVFSLMLGYKQQKAESQQSFFGRYELYYLSLKHIELKIECLF